LRPSEQLAPVVSDYDPVNGVLSVTKARVAGIDRDRTKINEDRRVVLCPRARSVLERQLVLREGLVRQGRIHHDRLFFHANGQPIQRLCEVHRRWQQTLKRLAVRYRTPYTARHTSVSWNLMIGRKPLFVAQQHGHRILTMLTVYAAWTEGSPEADIGSIRRAMQAPAFACRTPVMPGEALGHSGGQSRRQRTSIKRAENPGRTTIKVPSARTDWAMDWPIDRGRNAGIAKADRHLRWRSGRDSNPRPPA
jgi:integrase